MPRLPPILPVLGERRIVDTSQLPVLGECWSAGLRRRACVIDLVADWLARVTRWFGASAQRIPELVLAARRLGARMLGVLRLGTSGGFA